MKTVEVYDVECMANLFTYTGYNRNTETWTQFVVHKLQNEFNAFIDYLENSDIIMVGYNNLNYDYPLIHHMLNHAEDYRKMRVEDVVDSLYKKSQEIIDMEYSVVSPKNTKIKQIDLFKVHHWDNPAKATSLKHCEMAMRMDNIEEMPLHHTHWVRTNDEIEQILAYNKHDVRATNMLYDYTVGKTDHSCYKGRNKLALRQLLSKSFGINLLNHNDVKIGEDLVFNLYAHHTKIDKNVLKKGRTLRPSIRMIDCIPDYVDFKTAKFQNLLNNWQKKVIYSTKNAVKDSIVYQGIKLDYGTGGLHGSNSGIFRSDDNWIIIDADVGLKRLN